VRGRTRFGDGFVSHVDTLLVQVQTNEVDPAVWTPGV
jgi:hypothetical protein